MIESHKPPPAKNGRLHHLPAASPDGSNLESERHYRQLREEVFL